MKMVLAFALVITLTTCKTYTMDNPKKPDRPLADHLDPVPEETLQALAAATQREISSQTKNPRSHTTKKNDNLERQESQIVPTGYIDKHSLREILQRLCEYPEICTQDKDLTVAQLYYSKGQRNFIFIRRQNGQEESVEEHNAGKIVTLSSCEKTTLHRLLEKKVPRRPE